MVTEGNREPLYRYAVYKNEIREICIQNERYTKNLLLAFKIYFGGMWIIHNNICLKKLFGTLLQQIL